MRRDGEQLRNRLAALEQAAALRLRRVVDGPAQAGHAARVVVDGRELLNFCSNDYLGLTQHPELIAAAQAAVARWGSGSGAAHLVTGHARVHHELEEQLAEFTGRERALLFSTGYMANLGAITSFADPRENVLADRLSHASLLDAARLSGARLHRYAHNDATAAREWIDAHGAGLIATDGVFSMDGDVAPVRELAQAAHERQAWLLVDDAHGLGVLGRNGGGVLEEAGLDARSVPLLVGTLGKAFGSFGAFVAGDTDVIEYLMQRARSYVYTTALPPAVAATTSTALTVVRREPERRARLLAAIARLRLALGPDAAHLLPSRTPIQPLVVGDSRRALALSASLREAGFWVAAIRPPTVPAGSARLRITLSAAHTDADIDAFAAALRTALAATWN
jgi:8-amino-7-oxononanoate synthase